MRASIRSYLQSAKARREENGDAGFSLIELIVVVVILGVLAAVAIPVFLGLQGNAETSARETVAANAASQYAAEKAADDAATFASMDFSNLEGDDQYTITMPTGGALDDFCIRAVAGGNFSQSGPGCTGETSGPVSAG